MLNHIVIMGRLTRDPELRYTQSQTPVASFTVAVDRDFGGRDGGDHSAALDEVVFRREDCRAQQPDKQQKNEDFSPHSISLPA